MNANAAARKRSNYMRSAECVIVERVGHNACITRGTLLALFLSALGAVAQVTNAPTGAPAFQTAARAPLAPAGHEGDLPARASAAISSQPRLPAESLGRDDLLQIDVAYSPELTSKFRIGSDGTLVLPLLTKPIVAVGLTPVQLAAAIKQALLREEIMVDPSVNVVVLEYRSRTVTVVGAVLHPQTFQATGQTTLLDAIATAGGLAQTAGSEILVVSSPEGSDERSVQTIPVQELVSKANSRYNIALHGGEEIRVPEAGRIFVTGNVVHPGMFPMQGDGETTVMKALALSQGLQSYSTNIAYIYRRSPARGERQEIPVRLSRIMARKEQDIDLMADDVLYIPEAKGKRMSARVLAQIAGFGQSTAAGLLIYK